MTGDRTDGERVGRRSANPTTWTGSSAHKHVAVLEAAHTVFLRSGYLAASLDEVAEIAAVSKRTIYKHFTDKDTLFREVLLTAIGPMDSIVRDALTQANTGDLPSDLRATARALISVVIAPDVMQLRRIVIAESTRFPAVAAAWREQGPGRNVRTLAEHFTALTAQGELRCDDPVLAAQHFNWLVLGIPVNTCMFDPEATYTPAELHHLADEAVRVFLAAYR